MKYFSILYIFFFKYYSIQKHVCDVTDSPDSLKQVAILIKWTPIKLLWLRRTKIAGNMTAGSKALWRHCWNIAGNVIKTRRYWCAQTIGRFTFKSVRYLQEYQQRRSAPKSGGQKERKKPKGHSGVKAQEGVWWLGLIVWYTLFKLLCYFESVLKLYWKGVWGPPPAHFYRTTIRYEIGQFYAFLDTSNEYIPAKPQESRWYLCNMNNLIVIIFKHYIYM